MKNILYVFLILILAFQACNNNSSSNEIIKVSPQEVNTVVNNGDSFQLLDVRTPAEYNVHHLKNAQNICVTSDNFKEKVKTLDKEEPVYVYCKSGGRSGKAAAILKEMGFKKVYDLQGGITSWDEQGLQTVQ